MTENTNPKPFNLSRQKCSAEQLMYINNNNNNNLDDIYSAVINGASHMREFTVVHLGQKSASARWPPTRRPSCKLDL